jgi:ubiquitin carboxyl-terminal hydrolase 1
MRGPVYELRAVITHFGRHENGHYIAYRKHPAGKSDREAVDDGNEKESETQTEKWWRLSDDEVSQVSEDEVLDQGGVFMLFYDLVEDAKMVPLSRLETEEAAETADVSRHFADTASTSTEPVPSLAESQRSDTEHSDDESLAYDEGLYAPARPVHVKPWVPKTGSSRDYEDEIPEQRLHSANTGVLMV